MLRAVAKSLSAQLGAAPSGSDHAMTRLAAKVPRRAAATLSDWVALQHSVQEKRQAAARAKREATDAEAAGGKAKAGGKSAKAAAAKPADADAADEHALSPLMGDAVFGFVDGKRNAAEIAKRVCAEALSAGWWYYGETTPERVEKYLQAQVRDGLLAW